MNNAVEEHLARQCIQSCLILLSTNLTILDVVFITSTIFRPELPMTWCGLITSPVSDHQVQTLLGNSPPTNFWPSLSGRDPVHVPVPRRSCTCVHPVSDLPVHVPVPCSKDAKSIRGKILTQSGSTFGLCVNMELNSWIKEFAVEVLGFSSKVQGVFFMA